MKALFIGGPLDGACVESDDTNEPQFMKSKHAPDAIYRRSTQFQWEHRIYLYGNGLDVTVVRGNDLSEQLIDRLSRP